MPRHRTTPAGVLWVSTSRRTRGGISGYVGVMASTDLWRTWRVEHLATHVDGSRLHRTVVFGQSLVRLAAILARRPPLLAHVHTASRGSFLRKAVVVWTLAAARVPVVLHVHGGGFDDFHSRAPAGLRALIRGTLRRADRVVALGDGWADRLVRIAPGAWVVACVNPVAIAPVPVADRTERIGSDPGRGDRPGAGSDVGAGPATVRSGTAGGAAPVRVLFAGRLGPAKGVHDLLGAWAALGPPSATARLLLAGDGDVDGTRRRVSTLDLTSGVDVLGWLSRADMDAAMAAADVLVLPSRNEGQPMAVLEAMAHGLCVVASRVGGIPDLVDDDVTGLLVPPADPDALAATLRRVLDDPALRARLGAAARHRVGTVHDAGVVAARLDALYRDVLTGRGVTDLPAPAPRPA